MLLTELILSKKGPLAKVWISAHQERKLSKAQTLQVDVGETVEAILDQDGEPIALRMSGQLMLGVVRIYSRKAQYLMDDAKDVRDKISMAFRPGDVDALVEHVQATRGAITIQAGETDLGLMRYNTAMDWEDIARNFIPLGLHVANEADITLPRAHYASSIRSSSIARESEAGIDSQSFEEGGIDLGLDMGDDTISIEYGREARSERASSVASRRRERQGSFFSMVGKSVRGEEEGDEAVLRLGGSELGDQPGGMGMDLDLGGEGVDLGLDLGDGYGDAMDVDDDPLGRARARRESTALSSPPPEDEQSRDDPSSLSMDLSLGTANRIAELVAQQEQRAEKIQQQQQQQQQQATARPRKRVRMAGAVDEEIELEDGVGRRDVTGILAEENYLPSNKNMIALLQIHQDPVSFYSPTVKRDGKDYYLAGPLNGMAEELADLFMVPVKSGIRRGPVARAERDEGEDEEDVEFARREERRRASERYGEGGNVLTFEDDLGGFGDVTGLDLDHVEGMDVMATPGDLTRKRELSLAPSLAPPFSRAGSVARSIIEARVEASGLSDECPIAFFDTRLRVNGVPQTQSSQSQVSEDFRSSTGQGWSRNTVMAVEYLKGELQAEQGGLDEDKSLSFEKAAKMSSKRAASTMFFELLNLGTRDMVKLQQDTAYGDIQVRAKAKLFETAAQSRAESEMPEAIAV